MFAYVNLNHSKWPTTLFRVKRGRRYVVYCRNPIGLTAVGCSARVAKQRYKEVNQRVTDVCTRIGSLITERTQQLSHWAEVNDPKVVRADTSLFTIISLTMAKRLDALHAAFKAFECDSLTQENKEALLKEMETLLSMHTKEDFASHSNPVVIRRT